jgi:hypothetical protein
MREAAIQALLTTATIVEAATKCGVSERTLQRWLTEQEFCSEYSAAKNRLLETTINRLRSIGLDGVEALRRVAVDKNSPAGATVSAGRGILEVLLRAVEVQDFGARLTELEKSIAKDAQ